MSSIEQAPFDFIYYTRIYTHWGWGSFTRAESWSEPTKSRERYVAGKTARMLECLLVILLCFLLLAAYALWPTHVSVDIAQFPRKYADDKVYL